MRIQARFPWVDQLGPAPPTPCMEQPPTPPGEDASDRFTPSYFGVSDEWH